MSKLLLAALVSLFLTIAIMPLFIKYLRNRNEGQSIRDEGPKWHEKKSGTPTMGGLIFNLTAVLSSLGVAIYAERLNKTLLVVILGFLGYGIIGFIDDAIKVFKKRNLGLRAYQKLLGQILIAVLVVLILFTDDFPFSLYIPFLGTISSVFLFGAFTIIWLVGFSNAVNLSDGLDGLATGLSIIAYGTYAYLALLDDNYAVAIFTFAVVGALLGFIIFNHKPAKIFMGDVGSLALGGGLAVISLILNRPWSLLLIGIVFVLETLSVILQVISFKTTGKRIFKMTPVHHHFEMIGFNEWQVDILFWSIGLIGSIIYLILFR